MTVYVANMWLVVVLINFFKRCDLPTGCFVRNDAASKIDLFNALKFKLVGDDTFNVTVFDDVLDLLPP